MNDGVTKQDMRRATRAREAVTGRRWCRGCACERTIEGGEYYQAGNHQRYWRCAVCIVRRTPARIA